MSLRDWLGSVLRPQGFGDAMGRAAREGGSALANAVFLSHGRRPEAGPARIFDTRSEMESAGFKPHYEVLGKLDITSLTVDEQRLFKSLTTAMISFAFVVNSNGALRTMRRDNTSKFRNGLGPSLLQSTVDCGLFGEIEVARAALLSYTELFASSSVSSVLRKEKPASEDLLELFIIRSIELPKVKAQYGVVRTGVTGFDIVAVNLAEETMKSIILATQQYRW